MNNKFSRLDEANEEIYLTRFSSKRYKFFLFLEKLYKILINNKNGRIEFIVNYIRKYKPKLILELGSGVLPIYQFLPNTIKTNCKYYICEINKEKVKYLLNKYSNCSNFLEIKCSDAFFLPFKDNYFDMVISKGVFHHIDDNDFSKRIQKKSLFLKESKRVLKRDGINLLMDFYPTNKLSDILWHMFYKIILFEGDYNYLNPLEVVELFKSVDYKKIKSYNINTFKGLYYCVVGEK